MTFGMINEWNEEWKLFMKEQLEGENRLKSVLLFSEQVQDFLKNSMFKQAYTDMVYVLDSYGMKVFYVVISNTQEQISFEIDKFGNIDELNAISHMDEQEQSAFLDLIKEFNIVQKVMDYWEKQEKPIDINEWCNWHEL
ncbi:hypothetical protein COA01_15980 [Bacillus cereus]|uniref:hypothetical protein n=1 Tax=Bacillus cereus TaxID=1396 RepID=UPI000BFC951D|nr:hypothetical protein [Bacillus cereus]PGP21037.1 hypothetical protein COA01_15980 [Bacillus cereus]